MSRANIWMIIGLVTIGFSSTAVAQYTTPEPASPDESENGPAPARDLTGVWTRIVPRGTFRSGSTWTREPPKPTAWGQERFATARNSNAGAYGLEETNDPVLTRCYPPGLPRIYLHPYPFEIIHTPKEMVMLYEYDHTIRRVYTDDRDYPENAAALWLGYSVGHWEGDNTLVVTSSDIDERTWMDRSGYHHSDQLKVTEIFTRVDKLNLTIDVTMEDPIALAEPWVAETMRYELAPPHWELSEISCAGDYLNWVDYGAFGSNLEEGDE